MGQLIAKINISLNRAADAAQVTAGSHINACESPKSTTVFLEVRSPYTHWVAVKHPHEPGVGQVVFTARTGLSFESSAAVVDVNEVIDVEAFTSAAT